MEGGREGWKHYGQGERRGKTDSGGDGRRAGRTARERPPRADDRLLLVSLMKLGYSLFLRITKFAG